MKKPSAGCRRSGHVSSAAVALDSVRAAGGWLQVALLLILGLGCAARSSAAPELTAESWVWNFGRIHNGEILEHTFPIRNAGDRPLHLRKIQPSCPACLIATASPTILQPGQSGWIRCRLDPRLLQGPIEREIEVTSDDPRSGPARLRLQGTVVSSFSISPWVFTLGPGVSQQEATVEVTWLRPLRAPLSVIRETSPWLETEVTTVASNRVVVGFRLKEKLPRGRQRVEFTLATSDPEDPVCTLSGEIANPEELEVFPAKLQVEPLAKPQFRTLWVRQNGGETWQLADIHTSSGQVRVRLDAAQSSRDYRFQVRCADLQDALDQNVTVEMLWRRNDGSERWVRVPIRVAAGEPREDPSPGTETATTAPDRLEP